MISSSGPQKSSFLTHVLWESKQSQVDERFNEHTLSKTILVLQLDAT